MTVGELKRLLDNQDEDKEVAIFDKETLEVIYPERVETASKNKYVGETKEDIVVIIAE